MARLIKVANHCIKKLPTIALFFLSCCILPLSSCREKADASKSRPAANAAVVVDVIVAGSKRRLRDMAAAALSVPDASIEELELLSPEEKKFLVEDLNDTARPYPADKNLVDLLADQVLQTPDHIAVEDENTRFTYSELDELTNRFGHYLRWVGVRKDTLAPICLDRSVNMIIRYIGHHEAGDPPVADLYPPPAGTYGAR